MFERLLSAGLGSSVAGSLTLTTEQGGRTHERQITAEFANCSAYLFILFFFYSKGNNLLIFQESWLARRSGDHPQTGGESFLSSLSYNCTLYSIYWTSLRRPAALSLYVPTTFFISCSALLHIVSDLLAVYIISHISAEHQQGTIFL